MRRILLITFIGLGLSVAASAKPYYPQQQPQLEDAPAMSYKRIQKMDRRHDYKRARFKEFRTQREYRRYLRRSHRQFDQRHNNRGIRQIGHQYTKRGWRLAYQYDRASFNDSFGYHYGFFNRNGFFFNGQFYRYDRSYTYRDRVRGRGLFENRFYMPSNYRYYGFSRHRRDRM